MAIALKAYALTTKERLQFLGGAPEGLHQDEYNFAINLVSREIARICGRELHQVTHDDDDPEHHEGTGRSKLYLRSYPIVEIDSVTMSGTAVTDFRVSKKDREKGFIYRDSCWPMSVPRYNDLTRDPDFSRAKEHIAVAYTGGYKTPAQGDPLEGEWELPEDLEGCLFREVSDLLQGERSTSRYKSERTPGGLAIVRFEGQVNFSSATLDTLGGYVAPWVI